MQRAPLALKVAAAVLNPNAPPYPCHTQDPAKPEAPKEAPKPLKPAWKKPAAAEAPAPVAAPVALGSTATSWPSLGDSKEAPKKKEKPASAAGSTSPSRPARVRTWLGVDWCGGERG